MWTRRMSLTPKRRTTDMPNVKVNENAVTLIERKSDRSYNEARSYRVEKREIVLWAACT